MAANEHYALICYFIIGLKAIHLMIDATTSVCHVHLASVGPTVFVAQTRPDWRSPMVLKTMTKIMISIKLKLLYLGSTARYIDIFNQTWVHD